MTLRLGYTVDQYSHQVTIKEYNDTSKNHSMELLMQMPSIAYCHEFVVSPILSLTGTVGWQYFNVFYDYHHLGGNEFWITVNPKISLMRRKYFEYYVKLKLGASFWTHDLNLLPDNERRLFPGTANVITGFTFAGLNFFVNDNWGVNIEANLFSPELISVGASYRFYHEPKMKIEKKDE